MQQAWRPLHIFLNDCKNAETTPLFRLLLASDGTTVRNFKALFFTSPDLELIEQHEITLDSVKAKQFSLPPGEKAIERRVWLRVKQSDTLHERQMYAISTLVTQNLSAQLAQILQRGDLPLGEMIEDAKLPSFRDTMEVAHLPFPEVARGLSLSEETLFWARRYRLFISGQIAGSICEVFSPQLSSFSS